MKSDGEGGARVISLRARRSDHDVTNTVQVSAWRAVWEAVHDIFVSLYPAGKHHVLRRAFQDFDRLFQGRMPGYLGCDTVYHDIQHTLDMTLAMARLIKGHELSKPAAERLGPGRATLGVITALFHDSGYIRHAAYETERNGAEFTKVHVERSAQFLDKYLASVGLAQAAKVARQIVHYTGYEVRFDQIAVPRPRDRCLGHLLGTADLMAQMADRCYLEKCRDRLYPEFVLGGVAVFHDEQGQPVTRYRSGIDLLRRTLDFYETVCTARFEEDFGGVHRYMKPLFDGRNPYMISLEKNLFYMRRVLRGERWPLLRRSPPCVLAEGESIDRTRALVAERLREFRSTDAA
jgi:hypothetical protein